ncbi:hypothetical protein SAMD00019534_101260 [Acytostelium subglobosum LB1]|uniref:hypothetical protein n=1 Tax=Acytostelium subglobosum LB1 TaxID=1410327 RepID=UPI000644AA9C|nr:hypothetical protein SAMD00019534_101260 [Acytostelium subglobosum LB1]GAM26951.1 hypothetical protein SAMD00019534_101260 [Acytostelium subglobosum LB1]|eukprot:XP_012750219.1 hypothetical protein SAMD00019534_101260 [Acytostelium subglobosum LB1]
MDDISIKLQQIVEDLATAILKRSSEKNGERILVAIAGPPGAGKSTISHLLCQRLNVTTTQPMTTIVPMDGFHLDNCILRERNQLARKGSPPTFDVEGFRVLLTRLKSRETGSQDIVIPVFDRTLDLARAGGSVVQSDHNILLVEGNYLLLNQVPWNALSEYFDMSIFVQASRPVLEQRLIQRWLDNDHTQEQAIRRALSNDIPNAIFTLDHSSKATITIDNE